MKNVRVINPNKLDEVRDALDWAINLDEASVIITRWPCALKRFSKADIDECGRVFTEKCVVDTEKCVGCKKCTTTGCPAISVSKETKKASIDKNQCLGCEVCLQVCPKDAIVKEEK